MCGKCFDAVSSEPDETAKILADLAARPVMESPTFTDDEACDSKSDARSDADQNSIASLGFSSPNKYAQGGQAKSEAGTPHAQLLFGYSAAVILPQPGDGKCLFHSARASVVAIKSQLTSSQLGFFGKSVHALKSRIQSLPV